jgi:prevent-host-death family protein
MNYHTVRDAKAHLSELIAKACAGEEVIIAHGKNRIVKLVPITDPKKERVPGGFEGQFSWTDDAFDPLTEDEMRELGFEFE